MPSLKRSLGFASLGSTLVLAVVLSACGDDGGSTQPSIIIQPSTFSTIVSTTAPAAAAEGGGGAPAGGTVAGTQVYEVKSNDFLGAIADDFGIPPESIANFNQWEDGVEHVIHPGDTINIPPGAQVPDPDDEDEDDEDDEDESDETEATEEEQEEEPDPDEPTPLRRRLAAGDVHDRGGRHSCHRRREPRRHGRPAQRGQRQHVGVQRVHRRRRDPRPVRRRGRVTG